MNIYEEALNELAVEDKKDQRIALKEAIKTRDRLEEKYFKAQRAVTKIADMTAEEFKASPKSRFGD